MPVCKVTVYKVLAGATGETWTNVYNVNTFGPNDAAAIGETIQEQERNVCYDWVSFPKVSAQLLTGGPSVTRATPGRSGLLVGNIANAIPLFNVARITLTDGQNRPELKYLRGCVEESGVAGFNFTTETYEYIRDNYANNLPGIVGLCGPAGEPITGVSVQLAIQMRQLGWHRRTRVGFKRGWVPV